MRPPQPPPRAYAFLDRDGTLVAERDDRAWAGCTSLALLPGVGPALRALACAGWSLVVVTNQYPIGEGVVSRRDYVRQRASLVRAVRAYGVELLDVLHCPHPRDTDCRCAKPGARMVELTVRRHGRLDPARSVVIGDADADMGLAAAVGIRGIRVDSARRGSVPVTVDLATVVAALLAPADPGAVPTVPAGIGRRRGTPGRPGPRR